MNTPKCVPICEFHQEANTFNPAPMGLDSFLSFLSADPLTGKPWDFYFALRPTQGVYDIHDLPYSPEADG